VPIIEKHTLALFSLTTLRIGDAGTDIPLHQDFHMGGTNSVRGWDISPDRSGKNQWINTVEYRVTLMEPKVLSLLGLTADIGFQGAVAERSAKRQMPRGVALDDKSRSSSKAGSLSVCEFPSTGKHESDGDN